jgi:hypothetical protein
MAYNLSRAAGVLAGRKLGKARTATIRSTVINIPARLAFSAGSYTLAPAGELPPRAAVHDHVRQHPGPNPKRPDPPRPSAIPGPTQHPRTPPMTDRAIPATQRLATTPSRSTTGFQDQLAATRWI